MLEVSCLPDHALHDLRPHLLDALRTQRVALWWLPLTSEDAAPEDLLNTLDVDERQRWQTFRFPIHRQRFLLAHGLMRRVLGAYLGQAPSALRFITNQWGKPAIATPSESPPLHFNLSHSGDHALLALSAMPVGVDVECHREDAGSIALAQRFFSADEAAALSNSAAFAESFLRCWTAKEAVIKCVGMGLSLPLEGFSTLNADGSLREEVEVITPDGSERLRLWPLAGIPDCVATMALPASSGVYELPALQAVRYSIDPTHS